MRTASRALVLFCAIAALVASDGLSAARQKDKDKKVEDKKAVEKTGDDKKAGEEVGKVEVYKAKDGWRFKVLNPSGKSIAGGYVGHDKKEDALKELELLKNTLNSGKVEVKDAGDKK